MTKEERDAVKVEEKREKQLAKDAAKVGYPFLLIGYSMT
jgi:hypothetical protein